MEQHKTTKDIFIRSIQSHELPQLLALYQYLNPNDLLPGEVHLQQVWKQLLSDPKLQCLVVDLDGVLIASCIFSYTVFQNLIPL